MNSKRLVLLMSAVLFISTALAPLFAQDDDQPPAPAPTSSTADPPTRAARLDYISGSVSVQPGGVNDWVQASINRTLTTSDRIWADKNSRAELQLDTAAIRINSETSVTLSNVSDSSTQIELDQGAMYLSVSRLFPGQIYEVDTPNLAFTVLKPGRYRFDVDSNADTTRVLVHRGEGEATGNGPSVRIHEREGARFSGGRSMAHNLFDDPGYDGFDDWAATRDQRQENSISARYVAPGVVGYEDLDSYGYWRTIPPYGPVWVPTAVAPGWAPYRFGHWVWVAPWGWTWVDDAPWGYAPFHYGRWCHVDGYWGWVPGPIYVRPVWAPALVAWVGGPHWGVSIGFGVGGGYGWFPLGWREPFVPWYGGSRRYFRNVNVSNTNITNITYVTNNYYNNPTNLTRINYVNRNVPGAMTAVPARTLINGRPVQTAAVRLNAHEIRGANVMARPNVQPTRNALLGTHAGMRASVPPAAAFNRPVVTKMTPPMRRQPMRGVVTNAGQPGGMNGARPGPGINKPGMNTAVQPRMPINNRVPAQNRPAVVNQTAPRFPGNVHRPPAAGGSMQSMKPRTGMGGPANNMPRQSNNVQRPYNVPRPGNNVSRPGNRSVGTASGPYNRGPVNMGTTNREVQLNPNVPNPVERGGRPTGSVAPSVPHPNATVPPAARPQGSTMQTQPRGEFRNNVPRPGGPSYGNANAGVNNSRVNQGTMPATRTYPQGNPGGNPHVYQPSNNSGGRAVQQPRQNQKSTPKYEENRNKSRPQAYYGTGSPAMNVGARNSYSFPRPQPGRVRPAQSRVAQSGSYGRSAQPSYNRSSSGSYAGGRSYGSYSNPHPQYSKRASSSYRSYGSSGYSNRSASSARSYSRNGGSYNRGSSGYSRGSSSSRNSGGGRSSSGGGHSHGR